MQCNQETVVHTKENYRIILSKETRTFHKQYIVQKKEGGRYRNLSYHMHLDSIVHRYGSLLS